MSEVQFAKKHIRNRFSLMMLPHISDGLWSVYENAMAICTKNKQLDQTLKTFQNLLTFIPKWDETRLLTEVERIQTASGCTYLEELLTATLITYLRAFASVQYSATQDIEVEFERPPLPRFVHELYKMAARQCWEHAYLFKTYGVSMEQQAKNRRDIHQLLENSLDMTLDSFLPWKSIVEKYFKEPEIKKSEIVATAMMSEPEEHEEEHAAPVPEQPKKNVSFGGDEAEESEDEEDDGHDTDSEKAGVQMKVSEEECEIDAESIDGGDELHEEKVEELEAQDELVLKM